MKENLYGSGKRPCMCHKIDQNRLCVGCEANLHDSFDEFGKKI